MLNKRLAKQKSHFNSDLGANANYQSTLIRTIMYPHELHMPFKCHSITKSIANHNVSTEIILTTIVVRLIIFLSESLPWDVYVCVCDGQSFCYVSCFNSFIAIPICHTHKLLHRVCSLNECSMNGSSLQRYRKQIY